MTMTNTTKEYLREIIIEETQSVIFERRLSDMIDQVAFEMKITLTEEQKRSLMQRLAQSAKQNIFGLAVGAITALAGGGLYNAQSQYAAEAAAQAQQIENSNIMDSIEGSAKEKELAHFIASGGGGKWIWGSGNSTQHTIQDGKVAVLPPGVSVAVAVLQTKTSNAAPAFGIPSQVVGFESGQGGKIDYGAFDSTFGTSTSGGTYVDPFDYGFKELKTQYSPESGYLPLVMVGPDTILQHPDYILENGMTVQDYYNKLYFKDYFSIEDVENILSTGTANTDTIKDVEQLFISANPDIVQALEPE